MIDSLHVPGVELGDVVGRGGSSTVYVAQHMGMNRTAALKVDDRVLVAVRDQRRFLREVDSIARLSGHPHVVELYDAGMLDDGRPYVVMELCTGSLDQWFSPLGDGNGNGDGSGNGVAVSGVAARPVVNAGEVTALGVDLADALATAHGLGLLHRNIKPTNVLFTRNGRAVLSDFVSSAVTGEDGDVPGTVARRTPAFAAPELFGHGRPSVASDVYALAATLYAAIAGHPPRLEAGRAFGAAEITERHAWPVADIPGASPELMSVLRKALDVDPARRQASAAQLRDELRAVSARVSTSVPMGLTEPPSAVAVQSGAMRAPTGQPRRRRALVLTITGALVAGLLVGAWGSRDLRSRSDAPTPTPSATAPAPAGPTSAAGIASSSGASAATPLAGSTSVSPSSSLPDAAAPPTAVASTGSVRTASIPASLGSRATPGSSPVAGSPAG